jgi:predicted acylesterase/phospholipase RssA
VGWGVRLSTAFPPLLTGVLHRDMRLVDGGFVNNVPASVAAQEGASLVVASSIVSTAPKAHRFAEHGPIGRALSEFSPFARVHDATRSALGVFHATGMVESRLADVVFQPTFSTPDFVNMRVGRQVIEAARESALATAAVVKARWRELCAPLTRPAWANP